MTSLRSTVLPRVGRVLDEADVVIYDRLISQDILELARREALMIHAGKEGFGPSMAQEDINDLIVRHAKNGAQVVRLKSGDATVFGRLDEEIEAVEDHGITWHRRVGSGCGNRAEPDETRPKFVRQAADGT